MLFNKNSLPIHDWLIIEFTLYSIDSIDNENFKVVVDTVLAYEGHFPNSTQKRIAIINIKFILLVCGAPGFPD